MSSLIKGYEYDIFISYRQNDNKRDSWVTNFVAALNDELEATLKNPVSIYFDENPHDGLLESHQVGASLEKKLKCIVLIPIISQTYCDTESFAWQHEFLPFNKMAQEDSLGMNITLANGNVVSRVLPIKIHDIDAEDEHIVENELGGVMRAIDFIYKEAGVNRPLKPTDDRNLNIEKTDYQNQINKVANVLKEIGTSLLKKTSDKSASEPSPKRPLSNPKNNKRPPFSLKLISGLLFIPIILASTYFFYSNYYNQVISNTSREKSIAVLPFRNDSNDPANIYFCNGLMEDIINQLSQLPGVRVPSATSMLYYRDNPKPYAEIISELNVSYLLEASVRKTDDKALMNITLIDAVENEQLWSERMEMDLSVKDLFDIQYEVANGVANKLRLALNNSETEIPTMNYVAYDNYNKARDLLKIWNLDKNRIAIDLLLEAIQLDDKFLNAYTYLGQAYGQRAELSDGGHWVDSTKHYATIAYNMNSKDAGAINAYGYSYILAGDPRKSLDIYLESYKINPDEAYNYIGWCYYQLGEFEKAVIWADKNILNDPKNSIYFVDMANATNMLGLFDETVYYSNKALEINLEHDFVYDNLMEMEIFKGNYQKALEYSQRSTDITNSPVYEASQGILYYKMGDLKKAKQLLSANIRDAINEDTGDENSKIKLYELLQYRALVNIKLGEEQKGKETLQELLVEIENNISDRRAQKYIIMAGCYAVLNDNKKSIENLNIVLDLGYNDFYNISNNSLIASLQGDEEYEVFIKTVKERNNKMRQSIIEQGILKK